MIVPTATSPTFSARCTNEVQIASSGSNVRSLGQHRGLNPVCRSDPRIHHRLRRSSKPSTSTPPTRNRSREIGHPGNKSGADTFLI